MDRFRILILIVVMYGAVTLAFLTSTVVEKALLPLHLFSTGHCYFPGDCFMYITTMFSLITKKTVCLFKCKHQILQIYVLLTILFYAILL